jgi:5-methylcytosine-specific restriction protein A
LRLSWTRDELLLALDLYLREGILYAHSREVKELSAVLRSLPIHKMELRDANFRSPDRVALKLANLANHDPSYPGRATKGSLLDGNVSRDWVDRRDDLSKVAAAIVGANVALEAEFANEDDYEASEGKLLPVIHFRRECNKGIRAKKLRDVIRTGGKIECEVCEFDFEDK